MTLPGYNAADTPNRPFDSDRFVRVFVLLLAIFLIFYFSELANFSLSIDEETAIFRTDPTIWAIQDRWAIYLIERFLLSAPVVPFFPLFLFGVLASLGYMILARLHQYPLEDWRVLLLFVLFCAFPTLYFLFDFSMSTVPVGIGLLLCCLSIASFDRALQAIASGDVRFARLAGPLALQVLIGVVVIGIYQSLILLVAAGCCGIFLLRHLRGPVLTLRQILLVHACLLVVLVASVVLGLLAARGFQWLLGVETSYIGNFVQPERLLDRPLRVARNFFKEFWAIYGGRRAVYGYRYITFPALLLLGMFALAVVAAQRGGAKRVLFTVFYMLGIALLPFAINPISGGNLEYRAMVAVPYAYWFFAAGAVLSPILLVRRIAIALLIIVSLQCLYTFTHFQAQKRLVLDHDKLLASEIYQRIASAVPDFDRSKSYKVDLFGAHEFKNVYREIPGSTISASFFEWDGGNPYRIILFMKALGYANLQPIGGTAQAAILPSMLEMPVWPAQGSVRLVGDTILVRLGKEAGEVHKSLMPQQP